MSSPTAMRLSTATGPPEWSLQGARSPAPKQRGGRTAPGRRNAASSHQGEVAGVVGAAGDRVVRESEDTARPCEVTGATRDGVVTTAVLLRKRDQVVLRRGLEAEPEGASRLQSATARVTIRIEAPLELLR